MKNREGFIDASVVIIVLGIMVIDFWSVSLVRSIDRGFSTLNTISTIRLIVGVILSIAIQIFLIVSVINEVKDYYSGPPDERMATPLLHGLRAPVFLALCYLAGAWRLYFTDPIVKWGTGLFLVIGIVLLVCCFVLKN